MLDSKISEMLCNLYPKPTSICSDACLSTWTSKDYVSGHSNDNWRRIVSYRVTDFEEHNHMTAEALAIVFSPNLLRAPQNDFVMILSNMAHTHRLVKALITHVSSIKPKYTLPYWQLFVVPRYFRRGRSRSRSPFRGRIRFAHHGGRRGGRWK